MERGVIVFLVVISIMIGVAEGRPIRYGSYADHDRDPPARKIHI